MTNGEDRLEADVRVVMDAVLGTAGRPDDLTRQSVVEWDSLRHIELMLALEERFDVRFDPSDLSGMASMSAIVDLLDTRYAKASAEPDNDR